MANRFQQLERAWPNDVHRTGLSILPPRPIRGRTVREGQGSSRTQRARRPSSACVFLTTPNSISIPNSMQGSGLRRDIRPRRLFQRRGTEIRLPGSARQYRPGVPATYLPGLGGESRGDRGRTEPACRQTGHASRSWPEKISVIDFFDGNTYSHDPRRDFLNWNLYCCGSYDRRWIRSDILGGICRVESEILGIPRRLLPASDIFQCELLRHEPSSRAGSILPSLSCGIGCGHSRAGWRVMGYLSAGNAPAAMWTRLPFL